MDVLGSGGCPAVPAAGITVTSSGGEAGLMGGRAESGEGSLPGLPVISGPEWFEADGRPFVLRIECPLAFEEMVAALYGFIEAEEVQDSEALCGCVAVALLIEGLAGLQERAARIRRDELSGAIASPAFLALCRQRVAALLGH
jgi:hypothetical protein